MKSDTGDSGEGDCDELWGGFSGVGSGSGQDIASLHAFSVRKKLLAVDSGPISNDGGDGDGESTG